MSASRACVTRSPRLPNMRITINAHINANRPRSALVNAACTSTSVTITRRLPVRNHTFADHTDGTSLLYRTFTSTAHFQGVKYDAPRLRTSLADAILERAYYRLTGLKLRELLSLLVLDLPHTCQQDMGNVTLGTLFRVQILKWLQEEGLAQIAAPISASSDAAAHLPLPYILRDHAQSNITRQVSNIKLKDLGAVNVPLWDLQDFKHMMISDAWTAVPGFDANHTIAALGNPTDSPVLSLLTSLAGQDASTVKVSLPTQTESASLSALPAASPAATGQTITIAAAALDTFIEAQAKLLDSAQRTVSATSVILGAAKLSLACLGTLGLLALIAVPPKAASDPAVTAIFPPSDRGAYKRPM